MASVNASSDCPLSAQTPLWVWVTSESYGWGLSPVMAAFASVWSCHMRQEVLGIHSAQARACTGPVARNPVSHPCILKTYSSPCSVASAGTLFLSRVPLPTALLLVPPTLQKAKGFCLPFVGPYGWGAQYVAPTAYSSGISTHAISLFLWVPFQGHRSCPKYSSLSPQFHVDFSYSHGCIGAFLPISS